MYWYTSNPGQAENSLIRQRQSCTLQPYVDMSAGGLARNRHAKREIGDSVGLEKSHQPDPFRLIGTDRNVHSSAVIEAER